MKNNPKISIIIKAIVAILCVSAILAMATVGLTKAWAKIEVTPDFIIESPTQTALPQEDTPTETIDKEDKPQVDPCVAMHTRGPNGHLPIVQYNGRVSIRWYDSVENAIWFYVDNEEVYEEICMFIDEYKIPDAFLTYMDRVDMYLDVTFAEQTIVNDWYLVEKTSSVNLGKPNSQQLKNRYEIEWKHSMVKMGAQPDIIYLSKLKPDVIYSYTPDVEEQQDYPVIINDTGKPCVLYTKHHGLDETYGAYACPAVMIEENSEPYFACAFYAEGNEYRLMYTPATDEAIYNIAREDTILMTDLVEWYESTLFYMYIYNNTDKDYELTITRDWEENSTPAVITIKAGELIGCWGPSHTVIPKEIPSE